MQFLQRPFSLLLLQALMVLLPSLQVHASSLAEIGVYQDSGRWRLFSNQHHWNGPIVFGEEAFLEFTPGIPAQFSGPVTICKDGPDFRIDGIAPSQYESVFLGGLHHSYDTLDWPPTAQVEAIRSLVPPDQTFPGLDEEHAVTTGIRFREEDWVLSQWFSEASAPGDTIYLVDHEVRAYPEEVPLLWIQGVARIEGVVGHSLTVLVSDSLFLTGDLIVPGTDVIHVNDEALFGMAPFPSSVQVGLIGEGPVILAATLENGLGGFTQTEPPTCGLDFSPVVDTPSQARHDVIVTASILALGCMLETEFWVTTATDATVPTYPDIYDCGGVTTPPLTILPCPEASPTNDERGSFWFCGSLARSGFGWFRRGIPGPWNANIGYTPEVLRHDPNLLEHSPPFWPEQVWIDPNPLRIGILPLAAGLCGVVPDPEQFRQLWAAGEIGLQLTSAQETYSGEAVRVRTWVGGELLEEREVFAMDHEGTVFHPEFALLPGEPCRIHFEVLWEDKSWNTDGRVCSWTLDGPDPDPPVIQLSPVAQEICGQPLGWEEWSPRLQAQEVYVEFTAFPDPEAPPLALRVDTWLDGEIVDQVHGQAEQGMPVYLFPNLPGDIATGEHEFHLGISWQYQQWNADGTDCSWHIGTTAVEHRELPDGLVLRVFPNPANPVFRVEFALPVPGEARLALYDIAGRRVLERGLGRLPAGAADAVLDPGAAASGIYLVVLETAGYQTVEKVLLLK